MLSTICNGVGWLEHTFARSWKYLHERLLGLYLITHNVTTPEYWEYFLTGQKSEFEFLRHYGASPCYALYSY